MHQFVRELGIEHLVLREAVVGVIDETALQEKDADVGDH